MTENHLTRYPLFRLLSTGQLGDWLAAGLEIDCPAGFTLFQENTPPQPLWMLRSACLLALVPGTMP